MEPPNDRREAEAELSLERYSIQEQDMNKQISRDVRVRNDSVTGTRVTDGHCDSRTMQRKPRCEVEVSTACAMRAAGL